MQLTFRQATLADLPTLRGFEEKLDAHERNLEPTLKKHKVWDYYDIPKLIRDAKKVLVLIAEINGQPVGCGFAEIKDNERHYIKPQYGYLTLIYVNESQRGKKIGRAIIEQLINWLHTHQIDEITLIAYATNTDALRAYKKYGFEPYIVEMKLKEQ